MKKKNVTFQMPILMTAIVTGSPEKEKPTPFNVLTDGISAKEMHVTNMNKVRFIEIFLP